MSEWRSINEVLDEIEQVEVVELQRLKKYVKMMEERWVTGDNDE